MGWGRNASIMHTSLQGWQDKYFFFGKGIKKQSLINQYRAKHCIEIGLTKMLRQRIHGCFEVNSMSWTAVHCFCSPCHMLKIVVWVKGTIVQKVSEVKQKFLELVGGSSYWGFKLLGVDCTGMRIATCFGGWAGSSKNGSQDWFRKQ